VVLSHDSSDLPCHIPNCMTVFVVIQDFAIVCVALNSLDHIITVEAWKVFLNEMDDSFGEKNIMNESIMSEGFEGCQVEGLVWEHVHK
jgi:hypothetical protein